MCLDLNVVAQLLQLLLKASQDKRFVCEEADRALNAMLKSVTPLPLLNKLRPYVSHSNPRVRAKAAITISKSVSKMGLEGMNEFGLVSLVQMAADLLNDRLPEAREAARNIVTSIYEAYTRNEEQKQESWQNFCQSSLPPIHAQSMELRLWSREEDNQTLSFCTKEACKPREKHLLFELQFKTTNKGTISQVGNFWLEWPVVGVHPEIWMTSGTQGF
ncbi:hypothetical protein NC651_021465 [Populus alba x Populus x berolinensis]|nr:hypothetical protein NC651_021465 [Populus alba x Populus x berolinensis]